MIGAGRYDELRDARRKATVIDRGCCRQSTKAGDLVLKIPKPREGSFFPSVLEPRRRVD